jgi:hypothetical protein
MTHHLWLKVPEGATLGLVSLVVLMVAIAATVLVVLLGLMGAVTIIGFILGRNLTLGV